MEVAVDALDRQALAGERGVGRSSKRAREPLGVGPEHGRLVDGRLEPVAHELRPYGELARVEHLGGERLAQRRVHLGGDHAQALGLAGEVGAAVAGVQVGLDEQVAHAGLRRLPALGGRRRGTPGGSASTPSSLSTQPRGAAMCGQPTAVQGEVHLDVGVDPRRHLPVDLQHHRVAVGERGVGLLAGEDQARPVEQTWGRLGVLHLVEAHVVDLGLVADQPRPARPSRPGRAARRRRGSAAGSPPPTPYVLEALERLVRRARARAGRRRSCRRRTVASTIRIVDTRVVDEPGDGAHRGDGPPTRAAGEPALPARRNCGELLVGRAGPSWSAVPPSRA